jgi:hypothetical protein
VPETGGKQDNQNQGRRAYPGAKQGHAETGGPDNRPPARLTNRQFLIFRIRVSARTSRHTNSIAVVLERVTPGGYRERSGRERTAARVMRLVLCD